MFLFVTIWHSSFTDFYWQMTNFVSRMTNWPSIIKRDTKYNDIEMWTMMGSDICHGRRSRPRTIGQMRTIKNLPPDSVLCVEIPTVIKSTAGFRHRTVGFWRLPSLVRDGEIILYTLRSNNWWCGHVYLAEEDLPCPGPPSDVETLISGHAREESVWESPGHKTRFYELDCFDDRQYVSLNNDVWRRGFSLICETSESDDSRRSRRYSMIPSIWR